MVQLILDRIDMMVFHLVIINIINMVTLITRRPYRAFVEKGIHERKKPNPVSGGQSSKLLLQDCQSLLWQRRYRYQQPHNIP